MTTITVTAYDNKTVVFSKQYYTATELGQRRAEQAAAYYAGKGNTVVMK